MEEVYPCLVSITGFPYIFQRVPISGLGCAATLWTFLRTYTVVLECPHYFDLMRPYRMVTPDISILNPVSIVSSFFSSEWPCIIKIQWIVIILCCIVFMHKACILMSPRQGETHRGITIYVTEFLRSLSGWSWYERTVLYLVDVVERSSLDNIPNTVCMGKDAYARDWSRAYYIYNGIMALLQCI